MNHSKVETKSSSCEEEYLTIPGCMGYYSPHTLINRERVKRNRTRLIRSAKLDQLCQQHAFTMAQNEALSKGPNHNNNKKRQNPLSRTSPIRGANVQRGYTILEMHREAMTTRPMFIRNILNRNFVKFGVGTALGRDGKLLYMVQIFRGPNDDDDDDDEDDARQNGHE